MSPRTLTDELRSVLLSHALDAPEPNSTVDRILNDTVGAVTTLGEPALGEHRPGLTGRRLRVQQLAAAAVVAVLLLTVAGINSFRNRRDAGNSDTAATRTYQGASDQLGGQSRAAGSAALPAISNGAAAKAGPASPPTPARSSTAPAFPAVVW